jgi:hypothetical protein
MCVVIAQVTVATAEGVPEGIDVPNIILIESESVDVSWKPPSKPNGILTNYILYVSDGRAIKTRLLSMTLRGKWISCCPVGSGRLFLLRT